MRAAILDRIKAALSTQIQNILTQQLQDLVPPLCDVARRQSGIPVVPQAKFGVEPLLPWLFPKLFVK